MSTTSSRWTKYSKYEVKEVADGTRCVRPAPLAFPIVYDPLEDTEALVVDALNLGMSKMGGKKDKSVTHAALLEFVHDYDRLTESKKNVYRWGMSAFGGIAPPYHIELLDSPTIVWEFYSLQLCVQPMFSFTLTDKANPLRIAAIVRRCS